MKILLVAVAPLCAVAPAMAAVIVTPVSSTVQTTYDANILTNDLIRNTSPDVLSVTTTGSVATYGGDVAPLNNFDHLTDGAASSKVTNNDLSRDTFFDGPSFGTNPTITYNLNTTLRPLGYSITRINSILGWADTRTFSNQRYDVSVSNVGSPTVFNILNSVNYTAFGDNNGTPNSSQVTLTDSTGILATNVAAIRFNIINNSGSGQVFRELDVVGFAVPEPSIGMLAAAGLAFATGILRRRPRIR